MTTLPPTNSTGTDPTHSRPKAYVMRTDQLIGFLAAELEPVDRRRSSRALIIALAIGMTVTFGAMFIFSDVRYETLDAESLVSLRVTFVP